MDGPRKSCGHGDVETLGCLRTWWWDSWVSHEIFGFQGWSMVMFSKGWDVACLAAPSWPSKRMHEQSMSNGFVPFRDDTDVMITRIELWLLAIMIFGWRFWSPMVVTAPYGMITNGNQWSLCCKSEGRLFDKNSLSIVIVIMMICTCVLYKRNSS